MKSTLVKSWASAVVPPQPPLGLDFPSGLTAPSDPFVAFQFLNPHNDGLPFAGPGNQGCTYIWKVRHRQQQGYYSIIWWSQNDGHFGGDYYGASPYPDPTPPELHIETTNHNWEIASEGGDEQITLAGTEHDVVHDIWYTQALRVVHEANNAVTFRLWIQIPFTLNTHIIEDTTTIGYGDVLPPSPALTWGGNPWFPDHGHERLSGILRGIKIFSIALSEQEIFDEALNDEIATPNGLANIWYKKINPTPDDLLCEAGTGRNPVWADPANKASLWVGP